MIGKCVEHFDLILVSHVLIFICYQANNETGSGGKCCCHSLDVTYIPRSEHQKARLILQQARASTIQGMMLQYGGMREVSPNFATSFRDYSEVTFSVLIT